MGSNIVYIGTSIDGCIASLDGSFEWMDTVPNPEGDDLGFGDFMQRVDAVVMGRVSFETVIGFGYGWHYPAPGIILSSTIDSAPEEFSNQVQFFNGSPEEVVQFAASLGYETLYIDGGDTIQRFLRLDMIDEMIITEIPILLGGGAKLFADHAEHLKFELVNTEVLLGQMTKRQYRRLREARSG